MKNKIKILNSAFYAVLITCINVLYYWWQPYYKAIIKPDFNFADILTNIIYFGFLILVLAILFKKINKNAPLSKKQLLTATALIFLAKLLIDVAKIFLYKTSFFDYVNLPLDMIFLLIAFFVFKIIYCQNSLRKSKNAIVVFSGITIVLIAIHVAVTAYLLQQLSYYKQKYLLSSFIVKNNIEIFKCNIHISTLIIEGIFFFSLFVLFCFLNSNKSKEKEDYRISKPLLQMLCTVMALVIAFNIKALIIPYNKLHSAESASACSELPITNNDFLMNVLVEKHYRLETFSTHKSEYIVSYVQIQQYNQTVQKINVNSFLHSYVASDNYQVTMEKYQKAINYEYLDYTTVLATKVFYFGNRAIIFEQNEKVAFYNSEDINNAKENEVLTETVKYLLQQGYVEYFEYGIEYLKKYDNDFIEEYIQRYAQGEFTQAELELNPDLRFEYITDLANRQ